MEKEAQVSTDRIGLYPGTFDPPTSGHLDIIKRALHVVDKLVMGVAINAGKSPMFSLDERVAMVQDAIKDLGGDAASRVDVRPFDSLLMHFSKKCGATIIIRGLRAVSDFEYEFQLAGMNRKLNQNIETIFLMSDVNNQIISSRLIKEIIELKGDIRKFTTKSTIKALKIKYE